jgi:oligoendopeptidase F
MHLESSVIGSLGWIATIDSFQHWIYTHPGHTREQRTQEWLSLLERFGGDVDYNGFENVKANRWQRQLHLFHFPFYYIEYGIAQLGRAAALDEVKGKPQASAGQLPRRARARRHPPAARAFRRRRHPLRLL